MCIEKSKASAFATTSELSLRIRCFFFWVKLATGISRFFFIPSFPPLGKDAIGLALDDTRTARYTKRRFRIRKSEEGDAPYIIKHSWIETPVGSTTLRLIDTMNTIYVSILYPLIFGILCDAYPAPGSKVFHFTYYISHSIITKPQILE